MRFVSTLEDVLIILCSCGMTTKNWYRPPTSSLTQAFARKLIRVDAFNPDDALNEIRSIEKFGGPHANIIDVLGHGHSTDPSGAKYAFIDMELCEFNLEHYYKSNQVVSLVHQDISLELSEKRVWWIMLQIGDGLSFVHRKNLIHRDLKPRNGYP
jgi:serine/threonine protein kinase